MSDETRVVKLRLRPWPVSLRRIYRHFRTLRMGRLEALIWAIRNTYYARKIRPRDRA